MRMCSWSPINITPRTETITRVLCINTIDVYIYNFRLEWCWKNVKSLVPKNIISPIGCSITFVWYTCNKAARTLEGTVECLSPIPSGWSSADDEKQRGHVGLYALRSSGRRVFRDPIPVASAERSTVYRSISVVYRAGWLGTSYEIDGGVIIKIFRMHCATLNFKQSLRPQVQIGWDRGSPWFILNSSETVAFYMLL